MPRSTAGEGGTDKGFHCILIAPYPEMGAVFTPIARRLGCRLRVAVGQEDAAVAVARATPPDDCDVFLSRSINVAFLKRHTAYLVLSLAFVMALMAGSPIRSQMKPRFADLGLDASPAMLLASLGLMLLLRESEAVESAARRHAAATPERIR